MRVTLIGGLIYVDVPVPGGYRAFRAIYDPAKLNLDQLVIDFEARIRADGHPVDVAALRTQLMQALPAPDDEAAMLMGAFG